MRTRFILIHTSHAGNVGAAARAMKVMGFDDLVLVAPRWANVLRREETIARASGALDVLTRARIVPTLDDALDGMTHLCATAMTPRDFGPPTLAPRECFARLLAGVPLGGATSAPGVAVASLAGDLASTGSADSMASDAGAAGGNVPGGIGAPCAAPTSGTTAGAGVALLFGSERFGMRNEDVYRCHVALSIPTNPAFGSLNLAAALQVVAYEWRLALGGFPVLPSPGVAVAGAADARQLAGLLAHWEQALVALGYLDPAVPGKLMARLNQLFNRAGVTAEEVHILRGVAKAMLAAAAAGRR